MSGTPPARPRGAVARLGGLLALAGGAVLLGIALLTCWSVAQRWLTAQPVPGDFELVSIGSGVAVLGLPRLGHGAARLHPGGHLHRLAAAPGDRRRWTRSGCWSGRLVAALLAERLLQGARETLRSGTTTMVLGLPTWWAVGFGALAFAATALAALAWVPRLLRGEG